MTPEVIIRPTNRFVLANFPEIWAYRDLFSLLVWRDFAAKYKQTILGPIWFIIQPLLPTFVFTIVFGKIAGMSTDGIPGFLFFFCNQIAWGYFSNNFSAVANTLLGNQHIFSKVYFPRLVVPLSSIASNCISLAVQLVVFTMACFWFKLAAPEGSNLELSWRIFFVPFLLLLVAIQGLGFGLWMTVLTAKYRDLQQLSGVLIQMWMYGSAVVFPLSQVPEKYRLLVSINPVTFVTEAFRSCLLGVGTVSWTSGVYSLIISLLVLVTGLFLFDRVSRKFIDIV